MKRTAWLLAMLVVVSILLPAWPARAQQGTGWSAPVDMTEGSDVDKGGFSYLLCDPYQNDHLVWAARIGDLAYIYYQTDKSGEWSQPSDIIATTDPLVTGPVAVISPADNRIHLTWASTVFGGRFYYSNAPLDNAADANAWSKPILLHQAIGGLFAAMAVEPSGVLHVAYGVPNDNALQPALEHITSTDSGKTWSPPTTIFSTNVPTESTIYTMMTIDDTGKMHLTYNIRSFEYGAYSEAGYLTSKDEGQTWTQDTRIGGKSTTSPGLDYLGVYTFGDNEIHLTWHEPRRMHQYSTDGGATWSKPAEIVSLGAAFGGYNKIVRDSGGNLRAITGVADGLYAVPFRNGGWLPPEQIDNRYLDPHYWNMVVCGGNRLSAVFTDRLGSEHVWYFTRQLPVSAIARQPIPAPAATFTPSPAAEATPAAVQEVAAVSANAPIADTSAGIPPPSNTSTMLVLAIAILPVLALIAGVFVFKFR